jgi:hypothetical protein
MTKKCLLLMVCLILPLTAVSIKAVADPQQYFALPPAGQRNQLLAPPPTSMGRQFLAQPPSDPVLELEPLVGPQLPLAPPALTKPEIPLPFIGCWEGNPDRFDSIVSSLGTVTVGSPGRIVFCYHQNQIEVPQAEITFSAAEWAKNIAAHLGLGYTQVKVDQPKISTEIYAITSTQMHTRTIIPLKITDKVAWVVPLVPYREVLVDEELVSVRAPDALLVEARQELAMGAMHSVRSWHANFHRVVHP